MAWATNIRVSLTEDSPREIPVCRDLIAQIGADRSRWVRVGQGPSFFRLPCGPTILSIPAPDHTGNDLGAGVKCGGEQTVRVVVTRDTFDKVAPRIRLQDDVKPESGLREPHGG